VLSEGLPWSFQDGLPDGDGSQDEGSQDEDGVQEGNDETPRAYHRRANEDNLDDSIVVSRKLVLGWKCASSYSPLRLTRRLYVYLLTLAFSNTPPWTFQPVRSVVLMKCQAHDGRGLDTGQ
jgi:hypothetical protein